MPRTINPSKQAIESMVNDYAVLNQSLIEIGEKHDMSKATVRKILANAGIRIRGRGEHHTFKTSKKVHVANMVVPKSTTPSSLLADLLAHGHISQAEIDSLATPVNPAPVASSTTGISFSGMTQGQKERAGLQEVMRIVGETSKVPNLRQQQYADLWGRSGSWVSHNQAK